MVEVIEWSMDLLESGTPEFVDAAFDLWPEGLICVNGKVSAVFGYGVDWLSAFELARMRMKELDIHLGDEHADRCFHHCRWWDEKQPIPEGRCYIRFTRLSE